MSDKTRIYGKVVEINTKQVKDFYNERAKALKDSLSTVNLQTDSEASKKRDSHEKEHIIPKLELNLNEKVFEFGCGFGRFAEALRGNIGSYLGVDISDELIALAKTKFAENANFQFIEGDTGSLAENPHLIGVGYSLLMTMGVSTYLNDDEVKALYGLFCKISAPNARIYIRESVALIPERLTLNGFWSDNLQQKYTAIYRTIPEYEALLKIFNDNGFKLEESGFAYPSVPENAETTQFYFILKR
ncbi:MAG: class I SAM-dependent methyltransferase [Prevotellaceae bacterium]|jgi:SAM-dependent methyltransferase|nr:class I SAM-dependent methyltransferase [Prevotellaceae bacterium]